MTKNSNIKEWKIRLVTLFEWYAKWVNSCGMQNKHWCVSYTPLSSGMYISVRISRLVSRSHLAFCAKVIPHLTWNNPPHISITLISKSNIAAHISFTSSMEYQICTTRFGYKSSNISGSAQYFNLKFRVVLWNSTYFQFLPIKFLKTKLNYFMCKASNSCPKSMDFFKKYCSITITFSLKKNHNILVFFSIFD